MNYIKIKRRKSLSSIVVTTERKLPKGGNNLSGVVTTTGTEFLKRVNSLWGENSFELISAYLGSRKPVTLKHVVCGTEITRRADTFMKNACNYCRKTNPKNISETLEKRKQTNFERYGVEHSTQSDEIKEKMKQNRLERYGGEEGFKEKIKQTNIKKYGVEYATQSDEVKEKTKQTNLKKYGVEYATQSNEVKEKMRLTNIQKYEVEYPTQSNEVKEKMRLTNIQKYEVESPPQSNDIKPEVKDINIEKYGVEVPNQLAVFEAKVSQNSSEEELESKPTLLLTKEGVEEAVTILTETWGRKPTTIELQHYFHFKSYSSILVNLHRLGLFEDFCSAATSCAERDVFHFVESILPGSLIETNNRSALGNGKEIDIYIPSLKIGIEYCGLYWHSSSSWAAKNNPKPKNYHQEKMRIAREKGIHLIQLFESEWLNQNALAKTKIASYLGVTLATKKVFARKCKIQEISAGVAKPFIDTNHIQRYFSGSIRFGLFHEEDLVAAMTFRKTNKGSERQGIFELDRYCTDVNVQVVGGAGKLLKHFIRTYNPKAVTTFADLRWSNGASNMYRTLGFNYLYDTAPNYFYIKPGTTICQHRAGFQKAKLVMKFPDVYDDRMTEADIMEAAGYLRIFDAGNAKYEMIISPDE
jgi:predicted XRE-type DNA-binding protein